MKKSLSVLCLGLSLFGGYGLASAAPKNKPEFAELFSGDPSADQRIALSAEAKNFFGSLGNLVTGYGCCGPDNGQHFWSNVLTGKDADYRIHPGSGAAPDEKLPCEQKLPPIEGLDPALKYGCTTAQGTTYAVTRNLTKLPFEKRALFLIAERLRWYATRTGSAASFEPALRGIQVAAETRDAQSSGTLKPLAPADQKALEELARLADSFGNEPAIAERLIWANGGGTIVRFNPIPEPFLPWGDFEAQIHPVVYLDVRSHVDFKAVYRSTPKDRKRMARITGNSVLLDTLVDGIGKIELDAVELESSLLGGDARITRSKLNRVRARLLNPDPMTLFEVDFPTITDSVITDSDLTEHVRIEASTIHHGEISASTLVKSEAERSQVKNSTVKNSKIRNSIIVDSYVDGVEIEGEVIRNCRIVAGDVILGWMNQVSGCERSRR